MKKYFFLLILLAQQYALLGQTTWYVSNRNDGVEVDYTSLQSAHDASNPGDTLFVYPSPNSYGTLNVYKEIHIRGLGYRIDSVSQPILAIRTFYHSTSVISIGVNAGSENSSFESLQIGTLNTLNVDSIHIRKIEITSSMGFTNSSHNSVSKSYLYPSISSTALSFTNSSNNIVENCILNSGSGQSLNSTTNSINNIISNSIFYWITVNNSIIQSSICLGNQINGTLNEILNNVFYGGSPGEDDFNNIYGATNVFVGYPTQGLYSFDTRWQLAPDSPAEGAGINGVDCGIFGGPTPYKLSGIHSRPLIYELTAPVYVPNGSDLNITVKVRAEN